MALSTICRSTIIGGVGIHGPLIRVSADDQGGQLLPRWRWLGWLLLRDYRWSWSNVKRIERLRGPFGGVRGLRIVLAAPPQPRPQIGVMCPWFSIVRGFALALDPKATEDLLALAPASIPRADRRALFVWG
jgi:hypothetical protein